MQLGKASVLEKIDLPVMGQMVRQDKISPSAQVIRGTKARKGLEIANQVRLVEIATVDGDMGPVWSLDMLNQISGTLKSSHAAIEFRRQTEFGCKNLDESPLAKANATSHVAHSSVPFVSANISIAMDTGRRRSGE